MSNNKKTSPWVWVGIGCAGVLGILVIAVVGLGYFGFRYAKQVSEEMKDPVAREAKVKAVLGADAIPPGYFPVLGLSIPAILDTAILSDREDLESGGPAFDHHGFIYMKVRGSGQQKELRDYFEGTTKESGLLRGQSVRHRTRDVIRRGEIKEADRSLLYVAERGTIETHNVEIEGVTTMILIECRDDTTRSRFGIWFGPDPDPAAPVKSANFSGSPADEAEIRAFARHFDFCRKQ